MKQVNKKIFKLQPIASVISEVIPADQLYAMSAIATFTDVAAAGTLKLQASNDVIPSGELSPPAPVNWIDVPSATIAVTAGGSVGFASANLCYKWIRFNWVTSAGSGTFGVNFYAQSF